MFPSFLYYFTCPLWSWQGCRIFKSFLSRSKRTGALIKRESAESSGLDPPDDGLGIGGGPSAAPSARPVLDLTRNIKITNPHAVAQGGFADIYKGELIRRNPESTETGGEETIQVAVKLLRVFAPADVDTGVLQKRLNGEVHVWKRLDHPNIARFYGVSFQFSGRPALVTRWYYNGTAPSYLASRSAECRLDLVRDVCRGLNYLHSLVPLIVHGDLKGNNILVDDDGHAVLSDFGLSRVMEESSSPTGDASTVIAGSMRWQAPELLFDEEKEGDNDTLQPASDVWSFGCTAYELMTGRLPYGHHERDWKVIKDVLKGVTPIRHDDYIILKSRGLPELLKSCWDRKTLSRPNIGEVEQKLRRIQLGEV